MGGGEANSCCGNYLTGPRMHVTWENILVPRVSDDLTLRLYILPLAESISSPEEKSKRTERSEKRNDSIRPPGPPLFPWCPSAWQEQRSKMQVYTEGDTAGSTFHTTPKYMIGRSKRSMGCCINEMGSIGHPS